jgi:hypothetical protein
MAFIDQLLERSVTGGFYYFFSQYLEVSDGKGGVGVGGSVGVASDGKGELEWVDPSFEQRTGIVQEPSIVWVRFLQFLDSLGYEDAAVNYPLCAILPMPFHVRGESITFVAWPSRERDIYR